MTAEITDDRFLEQKAWAEGWRKSPLWLRLLGGPKQFYADRGSYRMKWGELSLRFCGVGIAVGGYETAHLHIAIGLGQIFINLPFLDRAICQGPNSIEQPRWGFSFSENTLHLNWGRRGRVIWMPWCPWYGIREYLDHEGQWRPRLHVSDEGAEAPHLTLTEPYHYMLSNGDVQHVTATITRERTWPTWQWFGTSGRVRKAPVSDALRRVQVRLAQPKQYIDVRFSDEVGERAGSWKGGTVGCSYEMKPGETPRHTLSRMQRERRFS
jgi:hypothetical protein